jgi:hypothetical protein
LTAPRKPSPANPNPWDQPSGDFLALAIFQNSEPYEDTQLASIVRIVPSTLRTYIIYTE